MADENSRCGPHWARWRISLWLEFPCKVKFEHRRPLTGAFFVIADANTKTYWWVVIPDSASTKPKRFSEYFARYHIEKTSSGFTVFNMSSTNIAIASSRGRYETDGQLATLVRRDFDSTVADPGFRGFAFVDGRIELRNVLPGDFFIIPLFSIIITAQIRVGHEVG